MIRILSGSQLGSTREPALGTVAKAIFRPLQGHRRVFRWSGSQNGQGACTAVKWARRSRFRDNGLPYSRHNWGAYGMCHPYRVTGPGHWSRRSRQLCWSLRDDIGPLGKGSLRDMAKRLSPARRAAAFNRKLVIARAKGTDDSHKLQQGPVRCPLTRASANLKGLYVPRGINLETLGRKLKGPTGGRFTVPDFDNKPRLDVGISDPASGRAPKDQ